MTDPDFERDFNARTNRDELARLRARVAELEAALQFVDERIKDMGFDATSRTRSAILSALAQGQGE